MNPLTQFLYRMQPTRIGMLVDGVTSRESEILKEHFAYLQQLAAAGVVFTVGRTLNADERTFGIVVFQAESDAAALRIMQEDPAVKYGIMQAELFPYRTALWSTKGPPGEGRA